MPFVPVGVVLEGARGLDHREILSRPRHPSRIPHIEGIERGLHFEARCKSLQYLLTACDETQRRAAPGILGRERLADTARRTGDHHPQAHRSPRRSSRTIRINSSTVVISSATPPVMPLLVR